MSYNEVITITESSVESIHLSTKGVKSLIKQYMKECGVKRKDLRIVTVVTPFAVKQYVDSITNIENREKRYAKKSNRKK